MDGLFTGKSHLEMDDDFGVPPGIGKPPYGVESSASAPPGMGAMA